jgi:hypothetical protein
LTTLSDVAEMLKSARREVRLEPGSTRPAGGCFAHDRGAHGNLAKGDMSVSALVRLLEAAGYDLKLVKPGHVAHGRGHPGRAAPRRFRMKLDVQVSGKTVAQLYRERDEYVLRYLPGTDTADFISLAMPVRENAWRWPRDLHPFFRQNLPEGYLLNIIREEFGPLLDGTDLSLVGGGRGHGHRQGDGNPRRGGPRRGMGAPGHGAFAVGGQYDGAVCRTGASLCAASVSGMVPKFISPSESPAAGAGRLGKPTLRTSRFIIKGSDDATPFLGFNEHYSMRVLGRLGVVPVATPRMSDDGRVLVVERFDVDEQGPAHARTWRMRAVCWACRPTKNMPPRRKKW